MKTKPTLPEAIGKQEIVHLVAARSGYTLKQTREILDAFTATVQEQVARGNAVRLLGFGTWRLRFIGPRSFKKIHTEEVVQLEGHHRVWFQPGALFNKVARK